MLRCRRVTGEDEHDRGRREEVPEELQRAHRRTSTAWPRTVRFDDGAVEVEYASPTTRPDHDGDVHRRPRAAPTWSPASRTTPWPRSACRLRRGLGRRDASTTSSRRVPPRATDRRAASPDRVRDRPRLARGHRDAGWARAWPSRGQRPRPRRLRQRRPRRGPGRHQDPGRRRRDPGRARQDQARWPAPRRRACRRPRATATPSLGAAGRLPRELEASGGLGDTRGLRGGRREADEAQSVLFVNFDADDDWLVAPDRRRRPGGQREPRAAVGLRHQRLGRRRRRPRARCKLTDRLTGRASRPIRSPATDGGGHRSGDRHQVGRCQLEVQAAPAARDEDRRRSSSAERVERPSGARALWPTGEMPPATYPVARSAAATSAITALLPPSARASALRSSWPSTGTIPTTSAPSSEASRVLKTRPGSTPSASAASSPYDAGRAGRARRRAASKAMPAAVSATVAGVPPAARPSSPSVGCGQLGDQARARHLGGRQRRDDVDGPQLLAQQPGDQLSRSVASSASSSDCRSAMGSGARAASVHDEVVGVAGEGRR